MELKINNEELGLASIEGRSKYIGNTLLFFYYPKRDLIVFNPQNRNYKFFLNVLDDYLVLSDISRKTVMDFIEEQNLQIADIFRKINNIIRIRRRLYQSRMKGQGK